MKALTFQGKGDVKVVDVPKPAIKESSEALIKVTLAAVCGTDLHILHGQTPMNQGAVLGHEFVGVVEEAGSEVKRFKPGDRVVSSFFTSCGVCALCRKGWFNQCIAKATFGHGEKFGGLGGGQSEYVVVPFADQSIEPIPQGMTDEQAIFVGDILSTGFFGAERAEIKPGDAVAIVGAGPVGLMATMCAQIVAAAGHPDTEFVVVDLRAATQGGPELFAALTETEARLRARLVVIGLHSGVLQALDEAHMWAAFTLFRVARERAVQAQAAQANTTARTIGVQSVNGSVTNHPPTVSTPPRRPAVTRRPASGSPRRGAAQPGTGTTHRGTS